MVKCCGKKTEFGRWLTHCRWHSYIALTGLGGHAFGSFKERDGAHMWLRDSLPKDVQSARVFTYGYDSVIPNSRSFQDLEALASTFRRMLVDLRRLMPVSGRYSLRGLAKL